MSAGKLGVIAIGLNDGRQAGNHLGRAHLGLSGGTIADILEYVEVPEPAGRFVHAG
jgi:hypothetical protein